MSRERRSHATPASAVWKGPLQNTAVVELCETAQGSALRRSLRGIPGYEPGDTGKIQFLAARASGRARAARGEREGVQ